MSEAILIRIEADTDIVTARQAGRRLADDVGFSPTDATLIATAISEIARNIVTYAPPGEIELRVITSHGRRGVEITARDEGPGIPDIELALQDGFSTHGGTGIGLPGARRLMDEFTIEAPPGKGTVIVMRRWHDYRP